MHSYIVSPSHISQLSSPNSQLLTVSPDGASIGIKQIRDLVNSLSNTSAVPRIVWIEPADLLTSEASNALLKALEEPPHHTTFYLATSYPGTLLPTIRSRCQTLKGSVVKTLETSNLKLIKQALSVSSGDRLTLAQSLPTDRSELIAWTEALLRELSQTIKKTKGDKSLQILAQISALASKLHAELKANVSTSLTLGNFFLHLPKVK